jgi:hypothetical protein
MTDKARILGGLMRKYPGGSFSAAELTLSDGDTIEVKRTDDLYSTQFTISTDDGNRSLMSSPTPPWHAGTNFVWPAIGRYDNDIKDVTILPGASGSEYTVGSCDLGVVLGTSPEIHHKTLLHGPFTEGANKPCNIQLTFVDNTTQNVTITPIILPAITELIHHVVVVPDSWGHGPSATDATDYNLATHWEVFGVHYNGTANGNDKAADANAVLNATFDFGTRAAGIGWATKITSQVHAAGRKTILCIGGENRTASAIYKWATLEGRINSVNEILAICDEAGFDGLMIDIEGSVNGYISYDVWMITADFCRRIREARPGIIMTGAIYVLLTSQGWPDYEHWWDFNAGKVACSTCFDWVENQSYGTSNAWYTQSYYTQWFSNPIYGGSGPFSWFAMPTTAGYEDFSTYSNHPVDWAFSSALMEKWGMPPQHVCMGYQWQGALRGPTVQAPGDSQASTNLWWQLGYDFVEEFITGPNIGTVVQDTAGVEWRHFNPPVSIGGSDPASWVDYPSPYFFGKVREFLVNRGHLGVLSFNRNASGRRGLPMAWPLLNPSKDFVSAEPTLTPITGATINSTATSAPITASGMNTPGRVSVSQAIGVSWRKTESGVTSAFTTADGTVANGGTVEFRKTTDALGGFTTQDPVIFCGWPLTLTVTTAAGSGPANTWSPTDKAASITLGGGNLVATRSGGAESTSLVRALRKIPTVGKWIWSIKSANGFGMATDTMPLTMSSGDYYGRTIDAWGYSPDGWHSWNGDNAGGTGWWGTWPTFTGTDDMTICWVPATQMLWIAKGNGSWNYDSAANPETGIGGLWTPMTGNLYAMAFLAVSPLNVATINMGRISLPRTVPGFTPLDNAP